MLAGHIVLATSKTSWLSSAIRWFTNSQFSHSFVTMPDILSFPMCIEAAEGGVDMIRFDAEYEDDMTEGYQVWAINIPQEAKEAALKQIINDLEVTYGILQYPWFIWRKLNSLVGKDIRSQNNWFRKDGMICSQLCVAYLTSCGLGNTLSGYGIGSIAPGDLQAIFLAHPEFFTLQKQVRFP